MLEIICHHLTCCFLSLAEKLHVFIAAERSPAGLLIVQRISFFFLSTTDVWRGNAAAVEVDWMGGSEVVELIRSYMLWWCVFLTLAVTCVFQSQRRISVPGWQQAGDAGERVGCRLHVRRGVLQQHQCPGQRFHSEAPRQRPQVRGICPFNFRFCFRARYQSSVVFTLMQKQWTMQLLMFPRGSNGSCLSEMPKMFECACFVGETSEEFTVQSEESLSRQRPYWPLMLFVS